MNHGRKDKGSMTAALRRETSSASVPKLRPVPYSASVSSPISTGSAAQSHPASRRPRLTPSCNSHSAAPAPAKPRAVLGTTTADRRVRVRIASTPSSHPPTKIKATITKTMTAAIWEKRRSFESTSGISGHPDAWPSSEAWLSVMRSLHQCDANPRRENRSKHGEIYVKRLSKKAIRRCDPGPCSCECIAEKRKDPFVAHAIWTRLEELTARDRRTAAILNEDAF